MSSKLYEYQRLREAAAGRPRHVDVGPTRRKVQALCALGWSATDVARALGITQQSMSKILNRPERIRRSTAERIDAVYTAWEMRTPPETPWTRRNRTNATKRGWLPPLAWEDIEAGIVAQAPGEAGYTHERYDEDLVDYVMQYHDFSVRLSPVEKSEIVRRWTRSVGSERELCRLTGWRAGRYREPLPTPDESATSSSPQEDAA